MSADDNKPQRMSALLASVATVATVKTTALGLWRVDKRASKEMDAAHHAKEGAGKASANRLAGAEAAVKELASIQAEGSDWVKSCTTAFDGKRLLANTMIERVYKGWGPIKTRFDEANQRFCNGAEDLLDEAVRNLGTYEVKLPTIEEIKGAFTMELTLSQIPDSANFRSSNLSKDMEEELRRQFEAKAVTAYAESQRDAIERVAEPLTNLVKRLAAYEDRLDKKDRGEKVGQEGTFRDTLMGNIQQIASVFGSFNLNGNAAMTKLTEALDAFEGVDADDLRNSPSLRRDMSKKAQAILDGLGDWL